MKKSIYLLMMLMVLTLGSCKDENRENLKTAIAEMQSRLPIDLGAMGKLTSVEYNDEDNVVTSTVDFNDSLISIKYIRDNLKTKSTNPLHSKADVDFQVTIESAKPILKYVYTAQSNGEKVELQFAPEDYFDNINYDSMMSDRESAIFSIGNGITGNQGALPQKIDEYTSLVDIHLVGNTLTYFYKVDESNLRGFLLIKANADSLKQRLMNENLSDTASKHMLEEVKKAGYDFAYVYTLDNTGENFTITFENSELPL